MDGPASEAFDVGVRANFLQVFGKNKSLWPFPVFSRSVLHNIHSDSMLDTHKQLTLKIMTESFSQSNCLLLLLLLIIIIHVE